MADQPTGQRLPGFAIANMEDAYANGATLSATEMGALFAAARQASAELVVARRERDEARGLARELTESCDRIERMHASAVAARERAEAGRTDDALDAAADVVALRAEVVGLRERAERAEQANAGWAAEKNKAWREAKQQRARADAAERERDLAIAHDRQPYPTADAYDRACAALDKHRERADTAEAEVERWKARYLRDVDKFEELWHAAESAEGEAVIDRDAERVRADTAEAELARFKDRYCAEYANHAITMADRDAALAALQTVREALDELEAPGEMILPPEHHACETELTRLLVLALRTAVPALLPVPTKPDEETP